MGERDMGEKHGRETWARDNNNNNNNNNITAYYYHDARRSKCSFSLSLTSHYGWVAVVGRAMELGAAAAAQ